MNRGRAMFNEHPDGYYIPANSAANAATSVLSKCFLRPKDMMEVRKLGYVPCAARRIPLRREVADHRSSHPWGRDP